MSPTKTSVFSLCLLSGADPIMYCSSVPVNWRVAVWYWISYRWTWTCLRQPHLFAAKICILLPDDVVSQMSMVVSALSV